MRDSKWRLMRAGVFQFPARPMQAATSASILLGGTLASAPAMAAVMLPVDQKYGRQGPANTVLYPPRPSNKPAAYSRHYAGRQLGHLHPGRLRLHAQRCRSHGTSRHWSGAGRAAQGMPSHNSPPSVYNYADEFESKAVERLISRNLVAALYRTKRTGARQ